MSELLWQPSEERIANTNMFRYMNYVNDRFQTSFVGYGELYNWSVDSLSDFWSTIWDFTPIIASHPYKEVLDLQTSMPLSKWFSGSRLNFAENLLRYRDQQTALIFLTEGIGRRTMTYSELYDEVAKVAASLRDLGIQSGDRIAGFMPNISETVIAMLAATSIGAVWSSCSPDFGINGVLDRFGQIGPKVLFAADGYFFKGNKVDCLQRISSIMNQLPSIEQVVVVPFTERSPYIQSIQKAIYYNEFKATRAGLSIDFIQLPFDHPLYIMYSSGTTGLPKCMVQSAGGVLINHLKELILHTDLKREDTIFYYTTCGWMMWNWLVSSLAVGSTVVLYDGNPFHPDPGVLWRMTQEERISVFGTSAGYIAALGKTGFVPGDEYNMDSLKAILSTGSPLSIEGFRYIYKNIKNDIQLSSISGGSDINGCFALGNPIGPVFAGEIQCRGLGMNVKAFDENGNPVINRQGELVCTAPAPSMPIYFWDDPNNEKYHEAYFNFYPNVWRHGDYIEIGNNGGVVIYGRSDTTLNPGGVRIGTADIYRVVESLPEIEDSLVIGQEWKNDVRVILFIKLHHPAELTDQLKNRIKDLLRQEASPRHVPAEIFSVPDVPYTLNMKKVELAVKKIIQGYQVVNRDALRNPESLAFYANIRDQLSD